MIRSVSELISTSCHVGICTVGPWLSVSVRGSFPSSSLINGKVLVGELEDDEGDAGGEDFTDVTLPGAAAALHFEELVAGGGEVFVPVSVAGLVEGLRGVEVGVVIVAAFFEVVFLDVELLDDVGEAGVGEFGVVLAGVVKGGDGGGGNGKVSAAAGAEGIADAPLRGLAHFEVFDAAFDDAFGDREAGVAGGAEALHLRDGDGAFIAAAWGCSTSRRWKRRSR